MRILVFFVLLIPSIASAQDLVCCGKLFIRADGDWIGAPRDCETKIPTLPEDKRAKACAQIFAADPGCGAAMKACDCAAVDAIFKADYDRWMSVRRDQAAAADSMRDEAIGSIHKAQEVVNDQINEELWVQLPLGTMIATTETVDDGKEVAIKVLEEAADRAKDSKGLATKVLKTGAKTAGVVDFLFDWTSMLAKIRLSLSEADGYSGQGLKSSNAAADASRRAYDIWKQREALEKACKQKAKRLDGAAPDPKEFDDDVQAWMTFGAEVRGASAANDKAIADAESARNALGTKDPATEKELVTTFNALSSAFRNEAKAVRKITGARDALKRLDQPTR